MSSEISIMDLCSQRILRQRAEARNEAREKSNAIERSAGSVVPEKDDDDGERPFMIPRAHSPYDIWYSILAVITESKEIVRVWELSPFFREILSLKQKYIQTRLPQIFQIILDRRPKFLLDEDDVISGNLRQLMETGSPSRQALSNLRLMVEDKTNHVAWKNKPKVKRTLLNLRLISKACKKSVEDLLQNADSQESKYFLVLKTCSQVWNMIDYILGMDTMADLFILPSVVVAEGNHQLQIGFSEAIGVFLELVGKRVKTFRYRSVDTAQRIYAKLREWVLYMPELENLQLLPLHHRWDGTDILGEIPAFPNCPKLRSFIQCQFRKMLPQVYFQRILEANSQINDILLPQYHGRALKFPDPSDMGSTLPQLERLNIPLYPTLLSFLDFRCPLKEIILHGSGSGDPRDPLKISSVELFPFLNQFRDSLEHLELDRMSVEVMDNHFLDLPHLKYVFLRTGTLKDLRFLVHAEPLEEIDIAVYWQNIGNIVGLPSFSDGFFMNVTNGFDGLSLWDVFPRLRKLLLFEHSVSKLRDSTTTSIAFWNVSRP